MDKRLLLINPVNPHRAGLTINTNSRFPPLGLGIVAALTPKDWDVKIIDENFEPISYSIPHACGGEPLQPSRKLK